jgi:L-asparaginase
MGRYATSLNLKKAGVVSGYDMTVEAAVAKLMFLLGRYNDNEKIKKELNTSLRGEVTII